MFFGVFTDYLVFEPMQMCSCMCLHLHICHCSCTSYAGMPILIFRMPSICVPVCMHVLACMRAFARQVYAGVAYHNASHFPSKCHNFPPCLHTFSLWLFGSLLPSSFFKLSWSYLLNFVWNSSIFFQVCVYLSFV